MWGEFAQVMCVCVWFCKKSISCKYEEMFAQINEDLVTVTGSSLRGNSFSEKQVSVPDGHVSLTCKQSSGGRLGDAGGASRQYLPEPRTGKSRLSGRRVAEPEPSALCADSGAVWPVRRGR